MKIIYVAGPFRAPTAWDIEQNVRRAEAAALDVARIGAMPLCPHTNTRFFHGQLTDGFWLRGTLELLRRCDALYLYDPATEILSAGTRVEVEEALARKIPVLRSIDAVRRWVAGVAI